MLRINRWLESARSGRWLIIVDNADDSAVLSQVNVDGSFVFPPDCPRGYILWTIRNRGFAHRVSSPGGVIQVSALSEFEGVTLLSKMTDAGESQKVLHDLGLLSSTLEHLPFAISQAASYMNLYNVSPGEFLDYFNRVSETQSVLKFEHTDSTRNRGWESLHKTWSLTFEHLSPHAIKVLALMSFLEPDSIPTSLLSQEFVDKLQLNQALSELRKHSLINSNDDR